jgi:cell division transport system permease protein
LSALKDNPLPAALVVTPKPAWQTLNAETLLTHNLEALPEVDMAKVDLAWLQRFSALLSLGETLLIILATLFCVGAAFVIASTIHLAIESQQEEIEVYQLIGASDGFIRRPFLYRGAWYGLLGAIVAWFIVTITTWILGSSVAVLATLYSSDYRLEGLGFQNSLNLLLLGVALGWVGAWVVALRRTRRFTQNVS